MAGSITSKAVSRGVNPPRPKQEVPADVVNRLMQVVRNQFCDDMPGDEWGKNSHFVKRNVILWPAHFVCNVKGFTVTIERYEAIMRAIFMGIKQHGNTGNVRYWPGYLMMCVQEHWKRHWEDYYNESKSARAITETAIIALGRLPVKSESSIESLASAHSILSSKSRRLKRPFKSKEQSLPGF